MAGLANRETERRYGMRKEAQVAVYVYSPATGITRHTTKNLSAHGLYIHTHNVIARPGTIVDLVFTIKSGNVVHLHRRRAAVAHVSAEGVGLMLHQHRSQGNSKT